MNEISNYTRKVISFSENIESLKKMFCHQKPPIYVYVSLPKQEATIAQELQNQSLGRYESAIQYYKSQNGISETFNTQRQTQTFKTF